MKKDDMPGWNKFVKDVLGRVPRNEGNAKKDTDSEESKKATENAKLLRRY